MTRVVNGIYDDVELETGFFIPDRQIDVIVGWLTSYADALEASWNANGRAGDPKKAKFNVVRSFMRAVSEGRGANSSQPPSDGAAN